MLPILDAVVIEDWLFTSEPKAAGSADADQLEVLRADDNDDNHGDEQADE